MHRYGLRVAATVRGQLQQSTKRPEAILVAGKPEIIRFLIKLHVNKAEQFHLADTKPFTDRAIAVFVLPTFLRGPLNCFSALPLGSPMIDRLPY